VEAHDEHELEAAVDAGAQVIGINNRDLTTLAVDTQRTFELLDQIPAGATTVSESGWRLAEDLRALDQAGVDAVLVGEALMRSEDIEAACRALTGAAIRS
ncbi:MAG: indole-3-glycerol phosphate synthase, partial [Solirubrobacteraceae bacterium]